RSTANRTSSCQAVRGGVRTELSGWVRWLLLLAVECSLDGLSMGGSALPSSTRRPRRYTAPSSAPPNRPTPCEGGRDAPSGTQRIERRAGEARSTREGRWVVRFSAV